MIYMLSMPWMAGSWYIPPLTAVTVLKDINGNVLSIGSKVKIVGTVVSIMPLDLQHGSVAVLPDYPGQGIFGINSLGTVLGG